MVLVSVTVGLHPRLSSFAPMGLWTMDGLADINARPPDEARRVVGHGMPVQWTKGNGRSTQDEGGGAMASRGTEEKEMALKKKWRY